MKPGDLCRTKAIEPNVFTDSYRAWHSDDPHGFGHGFYVPPHTICLVLRSIKQDFRGDGKKIEAWIHVLFDDGKTGWLPMNHLEAIL